MIGPTLCCLHIRSGHITVTRIPKKSVQFRCTRQLPPAARRPEHNFSASPRLSVATRTRYQKPLVPTFDWMTSGCRASNRRLYTLCSCWNDARAEVLFGIASEAREIRRPGRNPGPLAKQSSPQCRAGLLPRLAPRNDAPHSAHLMQTQSARSASRARTPRSPRSRHRPGWRAVRVFRRRRRRSDRTKGAAERSGIRSRPGRSRRRY